MALFGLTIFDQLTGGQWNEQSSCGFNQECKDAKACIAAVGGQARALYGESVYNAVVQACQRSPRPTSMNDVFCDDPQNAWATWEYKCPGFEPPPPTGLKIGKTTINWFVVATVFIAIIIIAVLFFL